MKANKNKNEIKQPPEDSRVAWFVVLEHAREQGNTREAAHAQAELERLGLRLSFSQHATEEGKQ
jgi:hypothetical protein